MTQINTKLWKIQQKLDENSIFGIIIRDRWTLTKSEKAQFKRNESILTQREHIAITGINVLQVTLK